MNVFDASALLAYLAGELGADAVQARLEVGGVCGAANWAEVAQKVQAAGAHWPDARALLRGFPLTVAPVTIDDAEAAAALWRRGEGLSLADRLCLALAARLGFPAITCDQQWAGRDGVEVVR